MQATRRTAGVALVALIALGAAAPAGATHRAGSADNASCVAFFVQNRIDPIPGPRGKAISFGAQNPPPPYSTFGQAVSAQARSPAGQCIEFFARPAG